MRNELLHGTVADVDQVVFQPAPGLIGGDVEKAAELAAKLNKIREDPANIGLIDAWVPSYLCQGTIVLTLDPQLLPIWSTLEKERGNRNIVLFDVHITRSLHCYGDSYNFVEHFIFFLQNKSQPNPQPKKNIFIP